MKTESIACNNCGGPLEVAAATNFVSCQHCGSQLAVRRTETAHFTEALSSLQGQIDRLTKINDIEALDRAWKIEKQEYMVTGKYGRHLPTRSGSIFSGIAIAVGGFIWTIMASSRGVGGFALFGIMFITIGVGTSIYSYQKAGDYEIAHRRYKQRRKELRRRG